MRWRPSWRSAFSPGQSATATDIGGQDLLQQSRRVLADADLLAEQARALKEGRKGTLKVSATPQLMTALLASFLPRYRQRHPGIEIQLIEGGAARRWNQLFERGETDLAVAAPGDARFPGRLLFPIHVLAAVPRTHRLARHAVADVVDLADEPLLLLQREFGTRACFDAACEIAQVVPRVRMEGTAGES